ncbi:MAG TPA: hypothetical protein VJ902_08070 [Wenzhouxiangellaceae bacterium]|nr:hypothetical protein [Wenzhouxiangellaceae bacterium]
MSLSANEIPRRTGGNFLRLLRGRGVAALLMLAAMALMARALPAADFGFVMLLHSFVLAMYGLVNPKPFEAVVLYGARHAGHPQRVEQLLRLTLLLDLATVAVALALAWFAAAALSAALGWSDQQLALARGYSIVLVTSASGWASGVLRLYNRFDVIANQRIVQGAVMLGGAAAAAAVEAGLAAFLAVQGVAFAGQKLYLQRAGWREIRRHHPQAPLFGASLRAHKHRYPGLGRFLVITYWQGNLDLFPKHLVVLGTGAFLGEAAAGVYRLVAQTTRVVSGPALMLRQVLFPDLARLWHAARNEYRQLLHRMLKWSALAAALFLGAALWFGETLVVALFGEPYRAGSTLLVWLMLAAGLDLTTNVMRAGLYARSRAGVVLTAHVAGVTLHAMTFIPLVHIAGLGGAGAAAAIGSAVTIGFVFRGSVR